MWVWWVVFAIWVIPISLIGMLICLIFAAYEIYMIKEEISRWE